MQSFHEMLIETAQKAKNLHLKERRITLESVALVGELESSNAWVYLGMSVERFAQYIGLTPSKYWKRAKVARMFHRFPEGREMFEKGETEISHLALIAGKITNANAATLFDGIRGKSKREVEAFISRVNCYGELSEERPTFDIYVRMGEEDHDLLMRARDVLAHSGHVPSNAEIIAQALDVLLDKKDPMRKAERAAARIERMKDRDAVEKSDERALGKVGAGGIDEGLIIAPGKVEAGEDDDVFAAPGKVEAGEDDDVFAAPGNIEVADDDDGLVVENVRHFPSPGPTRAQSRAEEKKKREAIPDKVRYVVWRRDEGRCTFVNPDGSRCCARMMLEIDHIKMVCDGGGNESENLRLRCRHHNQLQAKMSLGYDYRDINRGKVAAHRR